MVSVGKYLCYVLALFPSDLRYPSATNLSCTRISSFIRPAMVLCSMARAPRSQVPHPTRISGPVESGCAAA